MMMFDIKNLMTETSRTNKDALTRTAMPASIIEPTGKRESDLR